MKLEDRQKATHAWSRIHSCFGMLGVTDDEEKAIVAIMAAIYHLGVAIVAKGKPIPYVY